MLDGELPFFATREGKSLLKRFQALRPYFDRSTVDPLFCVVCPDRASAEPWLQRRHAGELDGIGLTGWNALERDRARNPNSPLVTLIDYLRTEGLDDEEEYTVQRQYTTIERIVENPAARRKIGLEVNAGVLCSLISPAALNAVMKALLAKVAATTAPSRTLNKAEAIQEFVDDLPPDALPNPSTFAAPVALRALRDHYKPAAPDGPSDGGDGPAPTPPGPTPPSPTPPTPPAPRPPPRRKTIFKRGEIAAFEDRARAIFAELVSLQHGTHPTAVTVLFRVFLERR